MLNSLAHRPLILLILLGALQSFHGFASAAQPSTAPSSRPSDARIKVGIIISQYTATGPCWTDNRKTFGFIRARTCVETMKDPQIERFAIIEPDTDVSGEASAALTKIPPDHYIDATDAAALKKLDVIVSFFQWNLRDPELDALVQAVDSGVAMLIQASAGTYRPGFTPAVRKLHGISGAVAYYHMAPAECTVVTDHPLTADLKDLPGKTVTIPVLSGAIGKINGIPLLECHAENMFSQQHQQDSAQTNGTDIPTVESTADLAFSPLYVSQLGKGHIVVCQWEGAGKQFRDATHGRFHIHAVQWLSGRPIK